MSLLAYNKTAAPLALAAGSPVVTLPAASSVGAKGPAVDVTAELMGLSTGNYALLQVQVAAGSIDYEWTAIPEYNTATLIVGSAQQDLAENTFDIYVDAAGNDNNLGTLASPVATLTRALSLKALKWRRAAHIRLGVGSFAMPSEIQLGGGAEGPLATPETWIGTMVDQVGARVSTAGTNASTAIDTTLASFRSGAAAAISAVAGGANTQARTMTVTGMTGLTSADVGKNFLFGLSATAAHNGTFKMVAFISATSATFANSQAVGADVGPLYWQDSYRGSYLRYTGGTAATSGARLVVGHGTPATGAINVVAVASLIDNDNFFVPDGTGPGVTFEYKVTGGFVPVGGSVTIDVSALTTAAEVAAATATAINAQAPTTLRVRATNTVGSAQVQVDNMLPGSSGNVAITEAVANAGFTVTGFTGGIGNSLNTFSLLGTGFTLGGGTAPTVGDTFVVEKSGSLLTYNNVNVQGALQRLGLFGIKFQGTGANPLLAWSSLLFDVDRLEFDGGGGSVFFNDQSEFLPHNTLYWANDPGSPYAALPYTAFYAHNAGFTTLIHGNMQPTALCLDHANFTGGQQSILAGTADAFQTTVIIPSLGLSILTGVFNRNFSTADNGIFTIDARGSCQPGSAVISNSTASGIYLARGAHGRIGTVSGRGNARVGIRVDLASAAQIDFNGTTTSITGALGDFEFGHETTPLVQSYATVRTADGTGTKGYADTHLNRVDVL